MSNVLIGLPKPEHAAKYFDHYLKLASIHTDLLLSLAENRDEVVKKIIEIPEQKGDYAYAKDKWSVKGVLLHIIDTERIFQSRALRLGRNDATSLVGFDENAYNPFAFSETRSFLSIQEEWMAVRNSTIELFKNYQIENLDFIGNANGNPLTARSAGWIMIGHSKHHLNVIQERYL
jgi:hypothetical protein